jgi:hypothetical protein
MWVRSTVLDLTARWLALDAFVVAINTSDHLAGAVNGVPPCSGDARRRLDTPWEESCSRSSAQC